MKAIVTVIGQDKVGIIAKVSAYLAEKNVNILDINQTIMTDIFTMIMMVDTKECNVEFSEFVKGIEALGDALGVQILATSEKIYKSMHRI